MISLIEERRPWPSADVTVVIDTSVLTDFALETAARHGESLELIEALAARGVRVVVPFHAAIELMCTLRRSVRFESGRQSPHAAKIPGTLQLKLHAVPIDSEFLDRYPTTDLPQLKAGDLLFLALARAGGVPLVTEDQELHGKAQKIGVKSFRTAEYLQVVRRNAG